MTPPVTIRGKTVCCIMESILVHDDHLGYFDEETPDELKRTLVTWRVGREPKVSSLSDYALRDWGPRVGNTRNANGSPSPYENVQPTWPCPSRIVQRRGGDRRVSSQHRSRYLGALSIMFSNVPKGLLSSSSSMSWSRYFTSFLNFSTRFPST